ncbi:CGNR zinc finger domain-containing protein [Hoeflea poritis]|uniref:ABATE domain-containing protein n=1 Tax=Hoeflea poritis TaxID=2993659 RepID=A0ABT4VTS1_9HYPH|nr:ABATE domain-containing protein [Hoeflea poritis]MDA4847447.1 ABATE domain-containing protein [Hoeflea poritis]
MKRTSFEFTAGCLSLNLVDTIANRASDPHDLLDTPDALGRWIVAAGLSDSPISDVSEKELMEAKALREAIFESATSIISEQSPEPDDIDLINRLAANTDPRPQWVDGEVRHVVRDPVDAALAATAADAVLCLSKPASIRIRRCIECQMLFQDNSRPQNRRWCSSSSGCGNRAKVRRHRAAKAQEANHG